MGARYASCPLSSERTLDGDQGGGVGVSGGQGEKGRTAALVLHRADCPALCVSVPNWYAFTVGPEDDGTCDAYGHTLPHSCTCSAPSGEQLAELGAAAVEAWAIIEGLGVYAEIEERLRKALLPFRAPNGPLRDKED